MFDCFELSDFKEKPDQIEIYFEEKNIHPKEYTTDKLESKGGYEQVRMFFEKNIGICYNIFLSLYKILFDLKY